MFDIPPQLKSKADRARAGELPWATVRRLLAWFHEAELTRSAVLRIDRALDSLGIGTEPDYWTAPSPRSRVTFYARSVRSDEGKARVAGDVQEQKRTALSRRSQRRKDRDEDSIEIAAVEAWAEELQMEHEQLQRRIAANGGVAEVKILCDMAGRPVRARIVNSGRIAYWMIRESGNDSSERWMRFGDPDSLQAQGYEEVAIFGSALAFILAGCPSRPWPHVVAIHVDTR